MNKDKMLYSSMEKYFCEDENAYIRKYIEGYRKITWYKFQISDLERILGIKFTKTEVVTVNGREINILSDKFFKKRKSFRGPKEYPCILIFGTEARNSLGYYYVDNMIIYPSDFEEGMMKMSVVT